MQQTPEIPDNCQWAIFLRNHDELTLEMVTDEERDYMYRVYANDPRMRINVGIRRRLAPLMDNNRRRIELLNGLLFSLPGTPVIYYGDEIGMGDNIYLGDRNGVRTPMQWSADRNAGFSTRRSAAPLPADDHGSRLRLRGGQRRGAAAQSVVAAALDEAPDRPAQALQGVRPRHDRLPRTRTIARSWPIVRAMARTSACSASPICRASPSRPSSISPRYKGMMPVELFGRTAFPPIGELPYFLTLGPHGFYWFRLATDAEVPFWHSDYLLRPELPVLVLTEGWLTFAGGRSTASTVRRAISAATKDQLQHKVLAPYLASKRWFAAKGHTITRIELTEQGEWNSADGNWLMTVIEVHFTDLPSQCYFLPLAIWWEGEASDEKMNAMGAWALARVRQKERTGLLFGAFGDDHFCRALVRGMGSSLALPLGKGRIQFSAFKAYEALAGDVEEPVHHPALEQSNTAVYFANKLFLKGYRRLQTGTNPEVEVGRFLTEESPFPHIVPVAGAIEVQRADGQAMTLGILQAYVENQGPPGISPSIISSASSRKNSPNRRRQVRTIPSRRKARTAIS